jgi:hypothetical protein
MPSAGDAGSDSPSIRVKNELLTSTGALPACPLHSRLEKSGGGEHVFANTTAREMPVGLLLHMADLRKAQPHSL